MSTPATPFPMPEVATVWTAISLGLSLAAGVLARKWLRSDRGQEKDDAYLKQLEDSLAQARLDGDLPRQCNLQRRLCAYRLKHGIEDP